MLEKDRDISSGHLGTMKGPHNRIYVKPGTRPIKQFPYQAGIQRRQLIDDSGDKMISAEAIESSQSEWNEQVVTESKKYGTPRFFVGYRQIHGTKITDTSPIPSMGHCIDSLGTSKLCTTLDENWG